MTIMRLVRFVSVILMALPIGIAAQTASSQDPADLLAQAQQRMRDGHPEEAVSTLRAAIQAQPRSFAAHNQLGVALDLTGSYAEARAQFSTAIDLASTPQQKAQAQRSMAMSYAFEGDCANAAKYEAPVYEMYLADNA